MARSWQLKMRSTFELRRSRKQSKLQLKFRSFHLLQLLRYLSLTAGQGCSCCKGPVTDPLQWVHVTSMGRKNQCSMSEHVSITSSTVIYNISTADHCPFSSSDQTQLSRNDQFHTSTDANHQIHNSHTTTTSKPSPLPLFLTQPNTTTNTHQQCLPPRNPRRKRLRRSSPSSPSPSSPEPHQTGNRSTPVSPASARAASPATKSTRQLVCGESRLLRARRRLI